MDWYYASGGQQRGPVSETEIARLIADGVIPSSTLVWYAGMVEWQPWNSIAGNRAVNTPSGMPPLPSAHTAPSGAMAGRFVYAGFWIRFLAWIIDGILLGAIRAFVLIPMGASMLDRPFASPWFFAHLGEAKFASVAIGLAYFAFFWTQYGATPGKMVLKLKVVTPQGGIISAPQAVGRYFGQLLSGMILGIGFMMAGWDDQKRALHDRLADTRVIHSDERT